MNTPSPTRRTWVYVQTPAAYQIAPCSCGNHDLQWSELVGHLWCEKCRKDFVPAHNGVFDGPIPFHLATELGMSFDRIDLATRQRLVFDIDTCQWSPAHPVEHST